MSHFAPDSLEAAVEATIDVLLLTLPTEECPCGSDSHDTSLEERLHTAWWQGYYRREYEVQRDQTNGGPS
jgi:hypothetical protein